jgi:hypothetical protein
MRPVMRFARAGFPFVGGAWLVALVAWIYVAVGETVRGGETVIAVLN